MLSQCAARFGETFTLRIVHEGTWVMLSNPEHVKQVFTGDPRVFHAGEGNQILLPVLGEHSLLLLDEAAHMEQRKLLLPPFHGQRMQRYGELMAEIAAEEIERWPSGEPYRLRPRMQAMTLEIILRAVFGLEQGERLERLRDELRKLLDMLTRPQLLLSPMVMGPSGCPGSARSGGCIGAGRRADPRGDRRAQEAPRTSTSARTSCRCCSQARHEDGSPMSDRELRDELLTLLVAGHETTATALAWAVERLIRHPDKLERLDRGGAGRARTSTSTRWSPRRCGCAR